MDPTTTFYLGTERTAMNGLVPFLPVPQDRTGLRHALSVFTICLPLVKVHDETSPDSDTDGVYGGRAIAPPSSATRVKRRLEFAELGCVGWFNSRLVVQCHWEKQADSDDYQVPETQVPETTDHYPQVKYQSPPPPPPKQQARWWLLCLLYTSDAADE